MTVEPLMFRTFGHETVEVVHAEGAADEKRFSVEAHVQPDSGFVSVDAPIYERDIVEIKDPRGDIERKLVSEVRIYDPKGASFRSMRYTELKWDNAPQVRIAPVRRLTIENFHPRIIESAGKLFADGHFSRAVTEEELEIAVEQRGTLITQYDADIARLDLQLQGMRHDQTHPHPDTCQFCHSTIATPPPTDEDIAAFEAEIARIQRLKQEATDDLDPLLQIAADLAADLGRNKQAHVQLLNQLTGSLDPATRAIQTQIDQLAATQRIKAEHQQLAELERRFQKTLDGDDETGDPGAEKFKPREYFDGDFYYSMTRSMQDILEQAHFPGAQSAAFNRQVFDIEIAGYAKADEQGKGYCAFFNTVVVLAFHAFMNRRSPHAPGFVLIDTPLHGFDEGKNTPNTSMRAGLFECFADQAKDQQIIILENTDRTEGPEYANQTRVIEFSKSKTQGRYGYLNDVYDVAEEANND